MAIETDLIHAYVELTDALSRAEDRVDEIKAKREEVKKKLLPMLQDSGVSSMNVGAQTVYVHRQVWASAKEGLVDGLRSIGADWLIKENVNGQTLSAWVREFDPDRMKSDREIIDSLPQEIRECVNVSEVFDIRVRNKS